MSTAQVLGDIMKKCFVEATKQGVKSIAFPALGAGVLSFPSEVVARVMISEASAYLSANPNCSLIIHFVIFMEDTHKCFVSEIAKMDRGAVPKSSSSDTKHFRLQNVDVDITLGDITEESTDAIVNPTNRGMRLDNVGVSGALLKKGGTKLQEFCDVLIRNGMQPGEGKVMVTASAGSLQCKSILHIAIESIDAKKLYKNILSCLNEAERLQCVSIAIPAVGTGSPQFPVEEAAKGTIKAIHEFSIVSHSHLHNVRLVLNRQDIYESFIASFQSRGEIEAHPGIFQRIGGALGSLFPPWQYSTLVDSTGNHKDVTSTTDDLENELYITIYGEPAKTEEVKKKLRSMIDGQLVRDELGPDEMVNQLTKDDETRLISIGQSKHVEIEIVRDPLNRIRFKGDRSEINSMMVMVQITLGKYKEQIDQTRTKEQQRKMQKKFVQWKRVDSEESEEYDSDVNLDIEQSFSRKERTFSRALTDTERIKIDFTTMEETYYNDQDSSPTFSRVVRYDLREGRCMDPPPI